MNFSEPEIVQLTENVFATMLRLPIEPIAVTDVATDALAASVEIAGEWQGSVELRCDAGLVSRAAAIMFEIAGDAVGDEERADAIGELTNMIGGNLKGLLPAPSHLSLPRAVAGPDADPVRLHVAFACDGSRVDVVVRERLAA